MIILSSTCDICKSEKSVEKQKSLLVRTYFLYCIDCKNKYAEPKDVINDFLNAHSTLPEWFYDLHYYDINNNQYKNVQSLI